MKRRAFGLLTVFGLVSCTWLQANAPAILAAIQDAIVIVDQIIAFVTSLHLDAAKQKEVDAAVQKVRAAIDAAANLLAGGLEVTQEQLAKAEADFTTAWTELMAVVGLRALNAIAAIARASKTGLASSGDEALTLRSVLSWALRR